MRASLGGYTGATAPNAAGSKRPDARKFVLGLVPTIAFVVPVELVRILVLRQLVRAVAERLVARKPALAQPLLFPVDDELRGLHARALDDPWHRGLPRGSRTGEQPDSRV